MRLSVIPLVSATLLGALATACVEPADDLDLTTLAEPLYAASTTLWSASHIPVCWENPGANATERAWVQSAAASTWQAQSSVIFTGWGTCNAGSRGIRIVIDDSGPHVKALGRNLDGFVNGMLLNFTFANWSPSCAGSQREFCIRAIAVHEFGHALGFAHEQNRPDRPSTCTEPAQGTSGDFVIGAWDLASVMNYCNPHWNGDGQLSATDIAGVQQLYGAPPPRFVGDFTGDGRQDTLTVHGGHFLVGTSTGAAFSFSSWATVPNWAGVLAPGAGARTHVGDFDGDGRDDFLFTWTDGSIWVGRSTGASFAFAPWAGTSWGAVLAASSAARTFVGDFTGDGRDDFLFTWTDGAVWVGRSTGTGFVFTPWASTGWGAVLAAGSAARTHVGDFDGDGRDDFLFTWTDGNWWVGRSTGAGFVFTIWAANAGWGGVIAAGSAARTFVGDFDGDGRDDFLFTWNDGTWWVGRSTGTSLGFGLWANVPGWGGVITAGSAARTVVADFSGDGRDDFLFTWPDGNWWVGTSTGTGFGFGIWAANAGWGSVIAAGSPAQVFAADFTGGGKDDFLFTWPDGTWWVGSSSGSNLGFSLFASRL